MEENSPVILMQRDGNIWIWAISAEDLLTNEMRIVQKSCRSYAMYDTAIVDVERAIESLVLVRSKVHRHAACVRLCKVRYGVECKATAFLTYYK
jgi:hypothetical protein